MTDEEKIPGIYNYCDRWCERCTHTSKCLNYQKLEEMDALGDMDSNNQKFWEKLDLIFAEIKDMLYKAAKEQGIDLDAVQIDQEEENRNEESAENHTLVQQAEEYALMVHEFFKANEKYIEKTLLEILDITKAEVTSNSIEVVRWYQHFIQVKIRSAVNFDEKNDIDINDLSEFNYSLGSAKIGFIAIERSMSALTVLYNEFPKLSDDILTILSRLERIKKTIEVYFPKLHEFKRPGFDM
jgi:hypothetical protein